MNNFVARYPAYDIIEPNSTEGVIIHANDEFAIYQNAGYTGNYRLAYAGSASAYAMQYGEDSVAAYNRAVSQGHETHWLNLKATSLTSHKQARGLFRALFVGQIVRFEGHDFTIVNRPNGNFGFKPV